MTDAVDPAGDAGFLQSDQGGVLFAGPAHAGQLNPLLAIAAELSRRGAGPLAVSSEEEARSAVEALSGAAPIRFLSTGPKRLVVTDEFYEAISRGGPMDDRAFRALFAWMNDPGQVAPVFRVTCEQLRQVRPRLMVIDSTAVGALDAALATGTPFVLGVAYSLSMNYLDRLPLRYPTPTSGLPLRMTARQQRANLAYRARLLLSFAGAVPQVALARRRAGLPNVLPGPIRYRAAARAVISYSVFGLEYPFRAPGTVHLLGAMIPPRGGPGEPVRGEPVRGEPARGEPVRGEPVRGEPARGEPARGEPARGELANWLGGHRSVVYVGLGTLARLDRDRLEAMLDAFTRLGPDHHVLWKLTADERALLPDQLPDHIRTEPWIPSQLDVLAHPHTRAFVTHGGANGVHEGIFFGVPLLVLPFWLDCYDLAARVVDAGVGLAPQRPPLVDAAELHAALRRLLSEDGFAERAQFWGTRLREAGGAPAAADLILRHAAADGSERDWVG